MYFENQSLQFKSILTCMVLRRKKSYCLFYNRTKKENHADENGDETNFHSLSLQ